MRIPEPEHFPGNTTTSRPRLCVTRDGHVLVAHAGSRLLADLAEATGLRAAFREALAPCRQRRGGHDPGRVAVDVAVMLADGGESITRGQRRAHLRLAEHWPWARDLAAAACSTCPSVSSARISRSAGATSCAARASCAAIHPVDGATAASIVIAGPGFTAVATLVTSPQMPGEVGYYALLPVAGDFSPVAEIVYDAAGHVLATAPCRKGGGCGFESRRRDIEGAE